MKKYLNKVKPYFIKYQHIINIIRKSNTWKNQLTIAIKFISSNDIDEEHVMYSKSYDIEIKLYDKAEEAIKEIFKLLFLGTKIALKHQ